MTVRCLSGGVQDEAELLALLGAPPQDMDFPCLVAYAAYYEPHAAEAVAQLLEEHPRVAVYKLPATLETLASSQVLTVSWETVRRDLEDGWSFIIRRLPIEKVLTVLAKRRAAKLRQAGEFDRVIECLSKKHRLRRRALRIAYGQIWRQLYPDLPLTTRKRYPWWKHLKRGREDGQARTDHTSG